jgi:hypothetical protein
MSANRPQISRHDPGLCARGFEPQLVRPWHGLRRSLSLSEPGRIDPRRSDQVQIKANQEALAFYQPPVEPKSKRAKTRPLEDSLEEDE